MWHQRNFEVAFDIRGSTRLMSDQSSKHIDSIQQLYHLHPEFLVNFGDQQWLSEICPHTVSHQANRLHTSLNQICARPQPTWRSKPGAGLLDRACPLKRLLMVLLINVHYVCKYTYILCIYIHIYIYIRLCMWIHEFLHGLFMYEAWTKVEEHWEWGPQKLGWKSITTWVLYLNGYTGLIRAVPWAQTTPRFGGPKPRKRGHGFSYQPKKDLKHVETHQAHQGS